MAQYGGHNCTNYLTYKGEETEGFAEKRTNNKLSNKLTYD
jgi:hypothetical protein